MASRKKTDSDAKQALNPFTGEPPNSFTQVTNRRLPEPVRNRDVHIDPGLQRRSRRAAKEHLETSGDAPVGYRLDSIDPRYRTFITGADQMLPNTAAQEGVPAINEPHEAQSGVTVQRRAEDLAPQEVKKGLDVLKQYGHDPRDPMESLRETHRRAIDHAIAQNIAAGVQESSSQLFYGGHVTTSDMDSQPEALDVHEQGVMAPRARFSRGVDRLTKQPELRAATNPANRREAATNLMAQSTADTSPQSKWRDTAGAKYEWPNMDQAEEAAVAGMQGRRPKSISGFDVNNAKAANRVADAVNNKDFDTSVYGDRIDSAKTIAFKGALVNKDSPDAFTVSDVHEAGNRTPWLSPKKSHKYAQKDEEGNVVGREKEVFEDTPKKDYKGLTQQTTFIPKQGHPGEMREVPKWGKSHPENLLAKGRSNVHALNDLAARQVLTERGLSRGVNFADNVHSAQGLTWGMRQLGRPDVNVSPADQFPVRRAWEQEGISVPEGGDIRNMADTTDQVGPKFVPNDRKGREQTIWPEDTR